MREVIEHFLTRMPLDQAALLIAVENLIIVGLVIGVGHTLIHIFGARRVSPLPRPIEAREIGFAISTVAINTTITVAGLELHRIGAIHFRSDYGPRALLDVVILLMVMDLVMYALHRVAHLAGLYAVHAAHHRYEDPRPLTLFVLSPVEALGFGSLWLMFVDVYDASWLGMSIYLALNVAFGAIGHLGVEPLPDGWVRTPVLRHVATSTFHAQHHREGNTNFGFYTLIWDRVFKTLSPNYERDFGRLPSSRQ